MHTRYYKVISRAAATAPQPHKYCFCLQWVLDLYVDPGFVCGSWIYMWILDHDPESSAGRGRTFSAAIPTI